MGWAGELSLRHRKDVEKAGKNKSQIRHFQVTFHVKQERRRQNNKKNVGKWALVRIKANEASFLCKWMLAALGIWAAYLFLSCFLRSSDKNLD